MTVAPSPCIFCQISRSSTPLLHSDDKVLAFRDINPSAFSLVVSLDLLNHNATITVNRTKHYLVIPIEHIPTVNSLQRTTHDFSLVSHMLDVGQSLLVRDAPHSEYRFGFHQPPFNSVYHLHLHCFALPFIPSWRAVKYLSLVPLGGFIEAGKLLQKIKPFSSVP